MNIDLMPRESALARHRSALMLLLAGALCLGAVGLTALGWTRWQETQRTRALEANVRTELAGVSAESTSLSRQWSALQTQLRQASVYEKMIRVAPMLRQAWSLAPTGVALVSADWNGGQLTLAGTAPSIEAVTAYQRRWLGLPQKPQVWVGEVHAAAGGYGFTLVVRGLAAANP